MSSNRQRQVTIAFIADGGIATAGYATRVQYTDDRMLSNANMRSGNASNRIAKELARGHVVILTPGDAEELPS